MSCRNTAFMSRTADRASDRSFVVTQRCLMKLILYAYNAFCTRINHHIDALPVALVVIPPMIVRIKVEVLNNGNGPVIVECSIVKTHIRGIRKLASPLRIVMLIPCTEIRFVPRCGIRTGIVEKQLCYVSSWYQSSSSYCVRQRLCCPKIGKPVSKKVDGLRCRRPMCLIPSDVVPIKNPGLQQATEPIRSNR